MKKEYTVTVTVPRFGALVTFGWLQDVACNKHSKIEPVIKGDTASFTFPFNDETGAKAFEMNLARIFNKEFATYYLGEKDKYKSDWEEFEADLKAMDWFYHFSDDARSWSSGSATMKELLLQKQRLSAIDKNRAEDLWAKYSKKN